MIVLILVVLASCRCHLLGKDICLALGSRFRACHAVQLGALLIFVSSSVKSVGFLFIIFFLLSRKIQRKTFLSCRS